MQDVNIVVMFYSRTGATERLALAAAVGAVQGRANIRLRRLPETAGEATIASDPEWKKNHERMNKEYVAPRETDASWADAVVIGTAASAAETVPEFRSYAGKIGAVLAGASSADVLRKAVLRQAMERAGLIVLADTPETDAIACARSLGRQAAEAARSRRAAASG